MSLYRDAVGFRQGVIQLTLDATVLWDAPAESSSSHWMLRFLGDAPAESSSSHWMLRFCGMLQQSHPAHAGCYGFWGMLRQGSSPGIKAVAPLPRVWAGHLRIHSEDRFFRYIKLEDIQIPSGSRGDHHEGALYFIKDHAAPEDRLPFSIFFKR